MSPTNRLTKTKGPRTEAAVEPGTETPKPRKSGGGELLATRREMAGKLGWSIRTLDRVTASKIVPVIVVGRMRMYRPDAVMNALQRNCEVKEITA